MRGKLTGTRRLMEVLIRAGAMVTFVSIAWAEVAAQITLTISGQRRTVACGGETLRIAGQRNTVTVTGECRKVDIAGSGNIVAIEAVAAIEVTGTNNKVTWERALRGDAPRVSSTGVNTVTRVPAPDAATTPVPSAPPAPSAPAASAPPAAASDAPARAKPDRAPTLAEPSPRAPAPSPRAEPAPRAPAPAPSAPATTSSSNAAGARRGVTQPSATEGTVTLVEDDREGAIDCRGREVAILGSRNTLHLRGSCPLVIVSGSDNVVDVDTAQRIRATGDRNRVAWTSVMTGAIPRVENTGRKNRVSKADRKPASP